ncbi:MAG: 50S ribosomal protein L10 [Nanobdellota archaeon]
MTSEIPKAADWKQKAVKEIEELISKYDIVGSVNMEYMPAKQLQKMRDTLRGTAEIRMAKRSLIKKAIENVKNKKKDIGKLEQYLNGMPALIFTSKNPFKLFKTLEKNKSTMAAKAGQLAPKDIVVKEGPTGFSPGPIIGELGAFKIKTAIENGKVAIKQEAVVAKQGDEISEKLANILSRMGIEPMEVGLDLQAVYEDGSIIEKDVLAVDEKEYKDNITRLSQEAFNLAMFVSYPTAETTELMVSKAHSDALALATEAVILNKESAQRIISKSEMQMQSVKKAAAFE